MSNFYSETVWNHFTTEFEHGEFAGVDGCRLRYVCSKQKKTPCALIVLGGRTEFAEKYAELFYDLSDIGFCVYSYDHRGQGKSQRLIADGKKGYVHRFEDYAGDLKIFLDQCVQLHHHSHVFVLAHSMGGTITIDFQQRFSGYLKGIILSSPMLGITTSPLPKTLAQYLVNMTVAMGMGARYIWGNSYYDSNGRFDGNKLTSDRLRFDANREIIAAYPEAELGGPTFNWLKESFKAMKRVAAQADRVSVPILMLQSGADLVVESDAQMQFCNSCSTCDLVRIDGARHELLMEDDSLRGQALLHIKSFLRQHSAG